MYGSLGDLGDRFTLHAKCGRCFPIGDIDVDALVARWGPGKPLGELVPVCASCGGAGALFRSWGRHIDFGGTGNVPPRPVNGIDGSG